MTEEVKSTAQEKKTKSPKTQAWKVRGIYEKLLEFQRQRPIIEKNARGYGYSYASLDNINEVIVPILNEIGLFIQHRTEILEDIPRLTTAIVNPETQQSVIAEIPLSGKAVNAKLTEMQNLGAMITYAKRYNITTLLNLDSIEDTDEAAPKPSTAQQKDEQRKPVAEVSDDEKSALIADFAMIAREEMKKELTELSVDELTKVGSFVREKHSIKPNTHENKVLMVAFNAIKGMKRED